MADRGRIMVVDDETTARHVLADLLSEVGYEVEIAADAFKALGKYEAFAPHVVVTDLKMPGMDGIELIQRVRGFDEPASVIIVTGFSDVTTAVEAMRAGAVGYLAKPLQFRELVHVLEQEFERQRLRRETRQLRERVRARFAPQNIIGDSAPMQRVFEIIEHVAASKACVLISGETGTGKELVANAIHERSPRAAGPFIKIHCAALAEALLESELFGHERGAFTGAVARRDGRFSAADGGTLFLDEIGEVSPAIQVKLLRFLQDHRFERVGGNKTLHVDVRIMVATNRRLADEVAAGRFREDLYYRLNVVAIDMPPLRDRAGDIAALAKFFLTRAASDNDKPISCFSPEALDTLCRHSWPGNVRELENAIERAVVFAAGPRIETGDLPGNVRPATSAARPPIPGSTLAEITRYAILETLTAAGGSTSRAAAMLGISARMIQYRLHEYRGAPHSDADIISKTD